jgi:hypothetical protein
MGALDQKNWEKNNPSVPYNPLSGMTGRQESSAPVNPLSGVGQYQTVDPNFTKVPYTKLDPGTKEVIAANAAGSPGGMTPQQYYESRGGVNKAGYFGDSWSAQANLTDAEYQKVINDAIGQGLTGTSVGEAITAATDAKRTKNGLPTLLGGSSSGTGTGTGTLGTTSTSGVTAASVNAIAAIAALLSSYGIGDLSSAITEAVQKGYTSDTIQLIMQDPNSKDPLAVAFQTRFPANKTRLTAGKSVLSAAEYLAAERSYTQVLQSYGVSILATRDRMNSFIGNDISAAEVSDRVGLAVDRVKNADPFTKAALAEYYPMLTQGDIVAAVLDPAEGLPSLKRKVNIAEIGGAAAVQGLKTGLGSMSETSKQFDNVTTGALGAEALASFGITQEEARKGYQTVASIAPRSEFLSSISTGEDYTRLQAEQEAFLGLASAKRARLSLTEQEQSRFAGQSGRAKTSLTNTGQGQY